MAVWAYGCMGAWVCGRLGACVTAAVGGYGKGKCQMPYVGPRYTMIDLAKKTLIMKLMEIT
jgi:hypothetical protein